MGPREKTLQQVRLVHLAFVVTWFLFIFVLQFELKPAVRPIEPIVLGAIVLAAVSSVNVGWTMRRKLLARAAEALQQELQDGADLARWRAANILSFAFAESVMLFGFVLKMMGASWGIAGWFFAGGLILLLLWTPRLESANV